MCSRLRASWVPSSMSGTVGTDKQCRADCRPVRKGKARYRRGQIMLLAHETSQDGDWLGQVMPFLVPFQNSHPFLTWKVTWAPSQSFGRKKVHHPLSLGVCPFSFSMHAFMFYIIHLLNLSYLTIKIEDANNYVTLYSSLTNSMKHHPVVLYINICFDECDNIPIIGFTIIYLNIL